MTPLHCQSEISAFGKANFYSKDSSRIHAFHITLSWSRNVYLYPKAYWRILVWTSCMTSFSILLSNGCFLHLIVTNEITNSKVHFVCGVTENDVINLFFNSYKSYNKNCTAKGITHMFIKIQISVTNIAAILIKEFFGNY